MSNLRPDRKPPVPPPRLDYYAPSANRSSDAGTSFLFGCSVTFVSLVVCGAISLVTLNSYAAETVAAVAIAVLVWLTIKSQNRGAFILGCILPIGMIALLAGLLVGVCFASFKSGRFGN